MRLPRSRRAQRGIPNARAASAAGSRPGGRPLVPVAVVLSVAALSLAAWSAAPGAHAEAAPGAFAPIGAQHDPSARYRLPFRLSMPRLMNQGVGGALSHSGPEHFAFDFAMPEGTEILAARAGTVAFVRDGETAGGFEARFRGFGNSVQVLHDDGTFAVYAHLRKGIPVRKGQSIERGEPVGWSGSTGYSAGPHLHFAVYRRNSASSITSVPIRFGPVGSAGFIPEEGQFYGNAPRTNVELIVTAGDGTIDAERPLRLVRGSERALKVMMKIPGLAPVDVTRSSATRYYSPTAWAANVDEAGRVRAVPTAGYAAAIEKMSPKDRDSEIFDWGVLVVTHADAQKGWSGFTSVPLLIEDPAVPEAAAETAAEEATP